MSNFKEKIALTLATVLYAGYIPKIPGTMGSLAAILFWALLMWCKIPQNVYLILLLIIIILGIIASTISEKIIGKTDPGQIVIDEFAGILITMFTIPFSLKYAIIGFIIFRIYDILKPFPINIIQKLPKGYGIMFDDILAGFFSFIILKALCQIV